MKRIINCMPNNEKYSLEIYDKLKELLEESNFIVSDDYSSDAELNITIGGDGAFLHGVRKSNFSDIPFIGINTGTLGFFPEISPEKLSEFVELYKLGKYKTLDMDIMECVVKCENSIFMTYALNDIAIKRSDMRAIHLTTYVNDNYLETISGDGIIISSTLGSSAYNYSCGGALVYPSLRTLQLTPISPISSKTYKCLNSSVIIPPEFHIKVNPKNDDNYTTVIIADGMVYDFENVMEMEFYTSNRVVKRMTLGDFNYWEVIKEKLL